MTTNTTERRKAKRFVFRDRRGKTHTYDTRHDETDDMISTAIGIGVVESLLDTSSSDTGSSGGDFSGGGGDFGGGGSSGDY